MSKYIFIADVHLSNKLPYSVPMEANGITDRFAQQLQMLANIAKIGDDNTVDGYIFLGDVFDKSVVDPVTFFHAASAFRNHFSRPVYVLPGNHDSVTVSGGPYITDIFQLLGVEVIGRGEVIIDKDVRFYPVEYMDLESSRNALKEYRESDLPAALSDGVPNNVVLFHNNVIGARNGGHVSEHGFSPEELLDGFDAAFGGHYHTPQEVVSGLCYVGAPMQHHFGDCGNKTGVAICEFKSGGILRQDRELDMPEFYQFDKFDIDFELYSYDYVRIIVECTAPEFQNMADKIKATKAEAEAWGVHLFIQHKPINQHEFRMESNRDELSYTALLQEYVENPDVNTGALSQKKLVEYGQELLQKAMAKNGNS